MSVVSSVKGVLWARKRQPDEVRYFAALAHERFAPDDLLQQAVEAENAGFDGICCSDHLAPWWSAAPAAGLHVRVLRRRRRSGRAPRGRRVDAWRPDEGAEGSRRVSEELRGGGPRARRDHPPDGLLGRRR